LCGNLPRLLEILEGNHSHVHWILTSTDKAKFTNSFSKTNKGQQQNAFRSRLAFYNLQPITTDEIKDFLFSYLSKIDPDEKVPDVFIDEGLQVIAENSKNNLRQAINDFATALSSEAYSAEDVRTLLGYEDEQKEYAQILLLARKDKGALTYISELEDVEGFFVYAWKIISNIAMREMTGNVEKEEWKERTAQQVISTGNLSALFNLFNNTWKMNNGYFNGNTFISELYAYYHGDIISTVTPKSENQPILKKKIITPTIATNIMTSTTKATKDLGEVNK
jgi:DNA polymerase III gamma/tau subunit